MPYIKPERRKVFDAHLEACAQEIAGEGDLNYCIYKLSTLLISRIGRSYDKLGICSSAMEHASSNGTERNCPPTKTKRSRKTVRYEIANRIPRKQSP